MTPTIDCRPEWPYATLTSVEWYDLEAVPPAIEAITAHAAAKGVSLTPAAVAQCAHYCVESGYEEVWEPTIDMLAGYPVAVEYAMRRGMAEACAVIECFAADDPDEPGYDAALAEMRRWLDANPA